MGSALAVLLVLVLLGLRVRYSDSGIFGFSVNARVRAMAGIRVGISVNGIFSVSVSSIVGVSVSVNARVRV